MKNSFFAWIAISIVFCFILNVPVGAQTKTKPMPHELVKAQKIAGKGPKEILMPHEEIAAKQKAIAAGQTGVTLPKQGQLPHEVIAARQKAAAGGAKQPGMPNAQALRDALLKKALAEAEKNRKARPNIPSAPKSAFSSVGGVPGGSKAGVCLYFHPADNFVEMGKDFQTTLKLNNNTANKVHRFEVTLEYDPFKVSYLGFDASPLKPYAQDLTKQVRVEAAGGKIFITGRLDQPLDKKNLELVKLKFKSTSQANRSVLRFLSSKKTPTALYNSADKNILAQSERGTQGLIDMNVFAFDPRTSGKAVAKTGGKDWLDLATALPGEMPNRGVAISQLNPLGAFSKPDAKVKLLLQPPRKTTVSKGEDFWIDLVLLNDGEAPLEALGATVRFDPKVLKVLDEDRNNYIKRGTNIWDGAFHDAYPFDFHRVNLANNDIGIIQYQVASHNGPKMYPSGIFARIHFEALAETPITSVQLVRGAGREQPQTFVRGMGVDRLEATWNRLSPPAVGIRVIPAPQTPVQE